ncbi:MAG: YggT family protein [Arenicellales bacterium]|nr:YggT family protein [Arenicellales bacterium]
MGNYFGDAGSFLIDTIIGLYILAVMLRFLLQWVRADFYNPVSQFLVAVTNPPLVFLRRFIPGFFGIDLASIVLLMILSIAKIYLLAWVAGLIPQFSGVVLLATGELLQLAVWVFIITLFIRVILSWIQPGGYNPVLGLINQLTEPLMGPARRLIPPFGGLDLSPIVVFIFLYLTLMLVVRPILDYGRLLAFA